MQKTEIKALRASEFLLEKIKSHLLSIMRAAEQAPKPSPPFFS
jgi:hypothetical protein